MRARAGQRVEETAREADQVDNLIRRVIPPQDLANVLDNIGLFNSTINTTYSNSGVIGESDAEILIGLKPEHRMATTYYVDELRARLADEFPGTQFFFQPADIVSQILNFGVPAPIDIQLIGPDQLRDYQIAQEITNRIQHIPGAVDVHVQQLFSYPTLFLNVDRSRALNVGLSQNDVANSMLLTLSSSFQINPSFWVNPAERLRVQRGRASSAVQGRFHAGPEQYPHLLASHEIAGTAGQPGSGERQYRTRLDHAL